MNKIILAFLLFIFIVMFYDAISQGLDSKIDSQNKMLCDSALKSGNIQYQKKCQPYYRTGDITLIREVDFK